MYHLAAIVPKLRPHCKRWAVTAPESDSGSVADTCLHAELD